MSISAKVMTEWPRGYKYSPQTGLMFSNKIGADVGFVKRKSKPCLAEINGYRIIRIEGKAWKVHRLAFLAMTGKMPGPKEEVDHINGNTRDNRWCNLRIVDDRGNNANGKKQRNGKLIGGSYQPHIGKWYSRIVVDGKSRSLGYYDTELEAHEAYMKFREENKI